jgi:hypothetical protein
MLTSLGICFHLAFFSRLTHQDGRSPVRASRIETINLRQYAFFLAETLVFVVRDPHAHPKTAIRLPDQPPLAPR